MLRKFLKFLFFLFLVLGFLSFGQFVLADEPREGETQDCETCGVQVYECEEVEIDIGSDEEPNIITINECDWSDCDETPRPKRREAESWDEYRCQGEGCGQEYIEKKACSHFKTRSVACDGNGVWDKGSWSGWSTPDCNTPSVIENCDLDWQGCSGSMNWSKDSRSCDCAGTCLETPENPRYYNDPDYPIDSYEPEESENSNNIFLPVKLDWDNVKAWKNGWQEEGGVLEECSEDCFQSYLIEIDKTTDGNFSKALTEDSEYNPSEDQEACFLKSDTAHNLNVSACCSSNGTNCGPESDWSFTTNSAPEPILPADPDWQGEQIKYEVEIPVLLDWCDVNDTQSFRVKINYIKDGEELCHPWLTFGGQCDSKVIRTENRPPPYYDPAKDTLYSDFQDNEGFFTKDTEYRWELATCINDDGTGCGEFGQKWGFNTTLVTLPTLQLESPLNDPNGEQAVGFPVILEWKHEPGMNSFIYDIYQENPGELTGNVNLSQKKINYPTLSLNTFYTWRVKPCWDYEGLDCEDWLVDQEWVFKTTGAPPKITSPENNAFNIPIPIKLDWNSISGAKSYRYYWLSSNKKLISDGIILEDFVLIEYNPDSEQPKQETKYYWQVATCADLEGNICGEKTELQYFETFKLSPPSNLLPENDETIFTYQMPKSFSWDSSAKYFRFILEYFEKTEENDSCSLGTEEKTINNNFYSLSLDCLGKYRWQVQACLDENCDEKGEITPPQYFILDQTTPPAQFGLVPCGRSSNNLDTPWNEREPCQFKHLFILFRNIIDFLLWRVTLLILLLLVIGTAMIFYFSIGAPVMIIDIKDVWRAAGKGYAIIFLSWIIINLVLNILGYQVGIFGQWWQINF